MNEKVSQGKLKRACVDCLFLTELEFHRIPDDFSVDPPLLNGFDAVHYEPDSSDRERFMNKDFSRFENAGSLGCYLGKIGTATILWLGRPCIKKQ